MTVAKTNQRIAYVPNGTTTDFAIPFSYESDSLKAYLDGALASGYSVSPAFAGDTGGTLSFTTAPASTYSELVIERSVADDQPDDYINNGPPAASTLEGSLDHQARALQDTKALASRAVRVPDYENTDMTLPDVAARAGNYAAYDSSGKPTVAANPTATATLDISALPAASSVSGSEIVAAIQSSIEKQVSLNQIVSLASNQILPLASKTIADLATLQSTSADHDGQVVNRADINLDYKWSATSTATADAFSVVAVSGVSTGRWLAQLSDYVTPQMLGAAADGVTDDGSSILAADQFCATNGYKLRMIGTFYTTQPITFTAPILETHCEIVKHLANSAAVIFTSTTRAHTGYLYAHNDTKPTTETAANGFVFQACTQNIYGALLTDRVYSGFYNDTASGLGLSWCNNSQLWYARDFVYRAIDWGTPGSGANTENRVEVCYINGKVWNTATLNTYNAQVINLADCDGFTFGTLNVEWVSMATAASFINLVSGTTLKIDALHFEGNEQTASGNYGIFGVSSSVPTNVIVDLLTINNNNQTAGSLFLVKTTTGTPGYARIGAFAGNPSSNTFSDFQAIYAVSTDYLLEINCPDLSDLYLTGSISGTANSTLTPNLRMGATEVILGASVNNLSGSTITIGQAASYFLSGSVPSSVDTISVTARPNEATRIVRIRNATATTISIANSGNIKPSFGASMPISWPGYATAVFEVDITTGRSLLVAVG